MWHCKFTSFLGALMLAASACDDPAPVVLGRLARPARDAASDAHLEDEEEEHSRELNETPATEHDDDASESERE
jgi:hypothetical protein